VSVVRSALFFIYLCSWTVILSTIYIPLLVMPRHWTVVAARFWLSGVLVGLRFLVGLTWELRGAETIPEGAIIVASKHQSTFETFAFRSVFPDPAFILKKELLWIPFFGWYLFKSGVIAIDRSAGTRALKEMVKGASVASAKKRQLIIFPEGTRAAPGAKLPYHSGVAMLYGSQNLPVVPIALNSGVYWPRGGFLKRPGKIIIEVLPVIPPGLDRKTFMAELENRIETASDRLVAEALHSLGEK